MYTDILLPVDLGNESSWAKALPAAIEYCEAFGSKLHVMTVMPDFRSPMVAQFFPDDHEDKLMDNAKDVLHKFVVDRVPEEIKVQHIVGHGRAYEEILRIAGEISCDMLILSTRSSDEGEDFEVGPNTAHIVRHAAQTVLIVR